MEANEPWPGWCWKDELLYWALCLAFAPVWLPLAAVYLGRHRLVTRRFTKGTIEQAWERCAAEWSDTGQVCMASAYAGAAFAHELAVALARRHRRQKEFFRAKLYDPDPLLAAYAFKCLVRVCDLQRCDLTPELFGRRERITTLCANFAVEAVLGEFFDVYFVGKDRGLWP
jgi:hypothetical protein